MTNKDIKNTVEAFTIAHLFDGVSLKEAIEIVLELLRLLQERASLWQPWKRWALAFVIKALEEAREHA